ncbi:MAG: hypothetical protein LBG73_03750 [Spirochaetaceae bacterium]|jgi:hypothetical protein|nr:hypothetical protein [Spirochaetaceae bacterium]
MAKKKGYWLLAIGVLAIGLSVAGCDNSDDSGNNDTSGPLDGTWKNGSVTVKCSGYNWEELTGETKEKGSFTKSGNELTFTIKQQYKNGSWNDMPPEMTFAGTLSADGNTISSLNWGTLTKE